MTLEEYKKKRGFSRKKEPEDNSATSDAGHLYLIHKHAASRLHYDFRLELNGTLKSWAIPKGPSLDPSEKRLAVHVEDHPLSYGSFEGTIPKDQYGGGTVMIWDSGFWDPAGNPEEDYKKGHLKFRLYGQKLHGLWSLSKMGGKAGADGKNWLLIKKKDEEAISADEYNILEDKPLSAESGRSMDEIADAENGERQKMGRTSFSIKRSDNAVIRGIKITSPDKILYPEQGATKKSLATFYEKISEHILPFIIKRPLTLVRCPRGRANKCFYQKHINETMPDAVRGRKITEKNKTAAYIFIDDIKGLLSLIQMGVLEIHPWGSSEHNLEKPDMLTFDLDPGPGIDWKDIVEGANILKDYLDALGLQSFVKTSGGKGIHIVIPIERRTGWDEAKTFTKRIAYDLAGKYPDRFVANMSKAKRKEKIFIDYLRNGRGATSVAAYSTRAREGAPVSVPIGWDELTAGIRPDSYNIENLPARLSSLTQDPWKDFFKVRQWITNTMKKQLIKEKKMPDSRIKNEKQYEKLRDKGMSKEKAARIANSPDRKTGRKGGKSQKYENWTKSDLYDKAKEVGIKGRSKMNKEELINALRNH